MEAQLKDLLSTAADAGIKRKELREITKVNKKTKPKYIKPPTNYKYYVLIVSVIVGVMAAGLPKRAYKNPIAYVKRTFKHNVYDPDGQCLMSAGQMFFDISRPIISCDMCKNITEVPEVYNMTREYFIKHHAYTGTPVLVKDGASKWGALKVFGYKYFKALYTKMNAIDEFDEKECQFFAYKTNFRTLGDVFEMSKKRAALKKDQWYIGWSNCIESVQNVLRQHYEKPKFLPDDAESSSLDWIFMGGSGTGALMHIDAVNRPSWQAMIKGKKTWFIEPPPECESQCPKHLSATMEPGDILVIDTNRWYHSTYIHPGSLAITIGSEYD